MQMNSTVLAKLAANTSATETPLKSFSSPAAATPPGTQQSVLMPGSTLGTYGGSGTKMGNYYTPGRFTGGLRSASSTPFASGATATPAAGGRNDVTAATTTPSKYLTGVSAVGSPLPSATKENDSSTNTSVATTPVQQAPVMTRQFFQSPGPATAATTAGSSAAITNKLLSLQSPAVYRRTSTGPTAFRQPHTASAPSAAKAVDISAASSATAAGGATGAPILNEGDQIACRELLGAQTELLKESEERLRALEVRFKSLLNNNF